MRARSADFTRAPVSSSVATVAPVASARPVCARASRARRDRRKTTREELLRHAAAEDEKLVLRPRNERAECLRPARHENFRVAACHGLLDPCRGGGVAERRRGLKNRSGRAPSEAIMRSMMNHHGEFAGKSGSSPSRAAGLRAGTIARAARAWREGAGLKPFAARASRRALAAVWAMSGRSAARFFPRRFWREQERGGRGKAVEQAVSRELRSRASSAAERACAASASGAVWIASDGSAAPGTRA